MGKRIHLFRGVALYHAVIVMALCGMDVAPATAQVPSHIVIGVCGDAGGPAELCPGGDAASLELFVSGDLISASGHGPGVPPGDIHPVRHRLAGSTTLSNVFQQPQFGGYSFGTVSFNDLGFDYAASPYFPALSKLPGPPPGFTISLERIGYGLPADLAVYTSTGAPRLLEDGETWQIGNSSDAHVHPFWLMRRPGLAAWTVRLVSDQWLPSQPYTYFFTSVPGHGELVPLDMTAAFNADVVDSDGSDSPTAFDAAGNTWLLNGHHGTAAGLPADGRLNGFQLGGPGAAGLAGAAANALFDNGTLSMAATIDLQATGQEDEYLGIEFLLGAAGSFTAADTINVTLTYTDNSTQAVQIKRATSPVYLPVRPLDDWQQATTPRPQLAVGRAGDRSTGFARSTGSGVDVAAGENTFFFRTGTVLHDDRTLRSISFADYAGSGRVAVFAMLAVRKAPLAIVTDALPAATEGQPYAFAVAAQGTPPFRNWSAAGLPPGLAIDPDSGVISGTPEPGAAAGSPYAVEVFLGLAVDPVLPGDSIQDYDANYPPEHASRSLLLAVQADELVGDINGDGVLDLADVNLFVAVLIGVEADPLPVERSDLNGDLSADGLDIAPMLEAFGL